MADERQILVASLREHFEGIIEATDLFLQNLSADNGSREELEAARGANSVLKSECADWRKRALETNGALKALKGQFAELEQRLDKMRSLCSAAVGDLKDCAPELYAKYNAELAALLGIDSGADLTAAAEPAAETAAEPAAEPAAEATAEPAAEAAEPAAEAAAEPDAETAAETAAEATAEPVAEAAAEPAAEVATEPAAETATEPAVEPVAAAATESAAEVAAPPKKSSKHADPKAALRELVKVSMSNGRGLKGIKGASGGRRLKKVANKEATVEPSASHDSASSSEENSDKPDPAAAALTTEAVVEPTAESVAETATEPAAAAATEPAAETAAESADAVATESIAAEVAVEPVVEAATEPATENMAEPAAAAATEPVAEDAAEPEEEPIVNNSKLKLPMFAVGRLKDHLEVTLDAALADKLDKISDIVEQTEEAEKLPTLELLPQLRSEDIPFVASNDSQVIDEVKAGLELSNNGEYDLALAKLVKLLKQDSYILQPNLAILHNYINMARWEDAYKAGLPLLYDAFNTDYWDSYAKDMIQAVINKMSADNSKIESKKLLFVLALVCAKYPVTARKFLRLADTIQEKCSDEAVLHYYLLKVGVTSASIDNTVEALQEITTCPELFDELFEQAKNPVNKKYKSVLEMIETLYLNSKDEAKIKEDKIESLVPLGPVQISPVDIKRYYSEEKAGKVVEFMLDKLFPEAGFEPASWPERFNGIIEEAKLIPFNFKPAEIFERLNARIFKFSNVDLRYYNGQEQFFVKAFNFEKGKIFILHAKMAELTTAEQQFIILRKCFQLYHKHTQLWHSRLSLDDTMMCKLLETTVKMCIESGVEAAEPWLKVVGNYDADTPNLYRKISETITRLYRITDYEPFLILKEFLFTRRPFTSVLDGDANRFAAKAVGITEASYGLARLFAGMRSDYDILAQDGFCALYADLQTKDEFLRKSLQLLWTSYLQNNDYI